MAGQKDAVGPGRVSDATFLVVGVEQLTVTTGAVVSLTAAKYDGAEHAFIQVDDESIRYWDDADTDPTTTVGIQIAAGDGEPYPGPLANFRMIATSGTAKVNLSYRKRV